MPISATQACAEATASASEDEVILITMPRVVEPSLAQKA
jgi:hypothetical protein